MSTQIIGADAAKLAGLQVDLLTKVRKGSITLEELEMFNNLTPKARAERFGDFKKPKPAPTKQTEKFDLLVDLGIVTVPDNYDHATRLATFKKENEKKFYSYNDAITDKNFPKPTRILKPGDKFHVRAYKQIVSGETTSEERMAFLAKQKVVLVGAQGASLVFEQKRDQLSKGKWYASFDEKDKLWKDADGYHRVPDVRALSGGGFRFSLGDFEDAWDVGDAFLCFCDIK